MSEVDRHDAMMRYVYEQVRIEQIMVERHGEDYMRSPEENALGHTPANMQNFLSDPNLARYMPLDERLAVYDFMIREQTTVLGRVVDYLVEQYGRERGSLRGMLPFVGKDERDTAMSLAVYAGK